MADRGSVRLRFHRVDALAPLAWCAAIRRGEPEIDVLHGRMVEVTPTAFFEGVWDGPFPELGFATSCTTMGSGARADGDRVHFVAPSHTYESLCTIVDRGRMWISNSAPFALAMAEDGPDLAYPWYHRDLLELQRHGITGDHPPTFPTRRGHRFTLHAATDLVVGLDLGITARPRPQPPAPRDFAAYRTLLADTVAALARNATDPARHHPLRVATTTSSGYDSPAVTVLAAAAGVREAITFETGAPGAPEDSGREIAETLGLRVHRYDAGAWRALPGEPELELLACASGWAMLPLASLADDWSGSVLFLGSMGDDLWRTDRQDVGPSLARPRELEPASAGLRELRLRAGIVLVHGPTIGAIHADVIHRISRSAEMAPWSLRNAYDRPVPRRIVEDAGIARQALGQKVWMTIDAPSSEIIERLHRSSFAPYVASIRPRLPTAIALRLAVEWGWGDAVLRAMFRSACTWWGRAHRLRLRPVARAAEALAMAITRWQWHRSLPVLYTFHWGTETLARRYRDALDVDRRADRLRSSVRR